MSYVDNLCKPRAIKLLGKEINMGSPANIIAETKPNVTHFVSLISLKRTIETWIASVDGNVVDLVVNEKSYQRTGNLLKPA